MREPGKQKITPEDSKADPKLALCDTENQIESAGRWPRTPGRLAGGRLGPGAGAWIRGQTTLDRGAWRSGVELPR